MRIRATFAALAAGTLGLLSPIVKADTLDPALGRLVVHPGCHTDPVTNAQGVFNDNGRQRTQLATLTGRDSCAPDDRAFKKLMNQWGFALAPNAMHAARSTGFGGFHVSLQAAYTKIDDGAQYWKKGTEGPRDPSTNAASTVGDPPGMIQLYSVNVRKNFGFGFEALGAVGFIPDSNIITGGADLRMSLLEGFRTGVGGIFPDIAVGGGIRTITGTSEFQLTTVGVDAKISKPLSVADSVVLTPWIGYQYVWIFADSGLIDTTPGTDPLGYCGYSGTNVPGNPDTYDERKAPRSQTGASSSPPSQLYDGQPVCAGGSPLDFNNNVVFNRARLERQRILFGLNYRYEMVQVGAQFITDIVDPSDAQKDASDKAALKECSMDGSDCKAVPRQWTLVFELGAAF